MLLHYCPQCGSKLQPEFKFCPSCGEKLPCTIDGLQLAATETACVPDVATTVLTLNSEVQPGNIQEAVAERAACSALARSPIRTSKRKAAKMARSPATPPKRSTQTDEKPLPSPQKLKTSPKVQAEEEPKKVSSPQTPSSAKGKAKRVKRTCFVEPVEEGLELCDQSGTKWSLVKLLCQTDVELTYGVQKASVGSISKDFKHICKMVRKLKIHEKGTKDGQLFNEQNFLQRAAKPVAVEKWIKKLNMDFLGIPSCVGFGVHETYRFLIFPNMGQTLQSILDSGVANLSERAALQLAIRLLDALEFIHENEYAHADIHAGNIYIATDRCTQVFLSGFGHAFRFCPGSNHVEYREGSRIPHQGNLNFISKDSHKGAGPSRRSDLQSLGYCLLYWMTGLLPWSDITLSTAISAEKERYMSDVPGLMKYCFKKRKLSGALTTYLSQTMGLQYTEKPDYSLLKAGINDVFQKMGGTLGEPLIR